jgi:hypothetical protein
LEPAALEALAAFAFAAFAAKAAALTAGRLVLLEELLGVTVRRQQQDRHESKKREDRSHGQTP